MIAGNELHDDKPQCNWCWYVELAACVAVAGLLVWIWWSKT